eukprot:6180570-Pleurochrysis_carterae.AAC.7
MNGVTTRHGSRSALVLNANIDGSARRKSMSKDSAERTSTYARVTGAPLSIFGVAARNREAKESASSCPTSSNMATHTAVATLS